MQKNRFHFSKKKVFRKDFFQSNTNSNLTTSFAVFTVQTVLFCMQQHPEVQLSPTC